MTSSAIRRGLLWLTSGVFAAIVVAVGNEFTDQPAIAILIGMTFAVAAGMAINPIVAAAEKRAENSRRSAAGAASGSDLASHVRDPGKGAYRGNGKPGIPFDNHDDGHA
jgi:hypothetical protein